MIGNDTYGDYIPDGISPKSLTRNFFLSVSILFK